MNWTEYCELAGRTESIPEIYFTTINPEVGYPISKLEKSPHVRATRLLHASLGLNTELKEFRDGQRTEDIKNMIEELGDIPWYLAIISNEFPNFDIAVEPDATLDAEFYVAQIADICKRHVFYGNPLEATSKNYPNGMLDALHGSLICLLAWVDGMAITLDCTVSDIWEANITKLQKRYPDLTFNKEHAVVRDVENELSHISPEAKPEAFFQQIEKENTEARLRGVAISEEFFRTTVMNELHWNDVPITFAGWALMLSNEYREAGCDAMAEGFKHIYIKLLAIKGHDLEAKAQAVMKDGWALFKLMDVKPEYEGEFIAWLMSKRNKI